MGTDKAEKKRLKAQYKLEKKGLRAQTQSVREQPIEPKGEPEHSIKTTSPMEKIPWYKNPDWIRAIAAIASLIVAMIAIFIGIYL
jgi:hypothetical protein